VTIYLTPEGSRGSNQADSRAIIPLPRKIRNASWNLRYEAAQNRSHIANVLATISPAKRRTVFQFNRCGSCSAPAETGPANSQRAGSPVGLLFLFELQIMVSVPRSGVRVRAARERTACSSPP